MQWSSTGATEVVPRTLPTHQGSRAVSAAFLAPHRKRFAGRCLCNGRARSCDGTRARRRTPRVDDVAAILVSVSCRARCGAYEGTRDISARCPGNTKKNADWPAQTRQTMPCRLAHDCGGLPSPKGRRVRRRAAVARHGDARARALPREWPGPYRRLGARTRRCMREPAGSHRPRAGSTNWSRRRGSSTASRPGS